MRDTSELSLSPTISACNLVLVAGCASSLPSRSRLEPTTALSARRVSPRGAPVRYMLTQKFERAPIRELRRLAPVARARLVEEAVFGPRVYEAEERLAGRLELRTELGN